MKKIFYSLILFVSLFIFNNKVNALQCLYEANDGEQVVVYQFKSGSKFKAYAEPVGDVHINGKTIEDSDYTTKVYNDIVRVNEWKETNYCFENLRYHVSAGQDEVYVCNDFSDCGKGDKTFYLKETYTQTPNHVGLNEMVCTYADQNESGYINTYSFVINLHNSETMSGSYSLWNNYDKLYDSDFTKNGINKSIMTGSSLSTKSYFDSFTIRTFWNEEKGYFACPGEIAVTKECDINALLGSSDCAFSIGYSDTSNSEFTSSGGFLWSQITSKEFDVYRLAPNASYIDYNSSVTDDTICVFTYEDLVCNPEEASCDPEVKLNLVERKYQNGEVEFLSVVNTNYTTYEQKYADTLIDVDEIKSCDDIKELYTDCFTTTNSSCKVSTNKYDIQYDENGFELNAEAEKLVPNVWSNTQDIEDVIAGMGNFNGYNYKKLVCELPGRLSAYVDKNVINSLPKLKFYNPNETLSINNLKCSDWGFSSDYNCNTTECKEQLGYSLEVKVKEVRDYCNIVYDRYLSSDDTDLYNDRKDECMSFDVFYQGLVNEGILNDMAEGCDFISSELSDKLVWILDLIKIVGPLLALGLGTLDFIKTIASGDADKEMKSAFKRFSTRLIAAVLLFIFPIILSFIMDLFLGNQGGYDPDNPFCDIVDWGNK